MMYEDLVRDFAARTRRNLEFINQHHSDSEAEVYEVTQLINSLLGLLVFPQQRFIDQIPAIPLKELEAQGWPRIRTSPNYPECQDLKKLVRYLRNAVTHFNVEFIPNTRGQIHGLKVWNKDPKTSKITWEAELSLDELRAIVRLFMQQLESSGIIVEHEKEE
jgi:hypothetical protein